MEDTISNSLTFEKSRYSDVSYMAKDNPPIFTQEQREAQKAWALLG